MDELVEKVLRIAALVEDRDDAMAFRLSRLARTLSAAKQTDVKLDSWDDFAAWWNQNRSQGLLFSLVDALGSDNPIIGQMKSVMAEQDQLEAKLHDIYLQLKGQQGTLPSETSAPLTETEPMPAAEPAQALDDGADAGGDAADLDAVLDEAEKGARVKIANDLSLMIELAEEIRALVRAKKPVPAITADDLAALVLEQNEIFDEEAEKGAGVKKKSAAPDLSLLTEEGWPSTDDVADLIKETRDAIDWDHLVRTTGDVDVDVRLRVQKGKSGWAYEIKTGDAGYDTDHNGFWGSGSLSKDSNVTELADELLDQAEGAFVEYMDEGSTSASTRQA